jgi:hypothetical protein
VLDGARWARRPALRGRRLASVGAAVSLLLYLLPICAAAPRAGLGGGTDRAPGIVLARYRQAPFDVATDDRPLPAPSLLALPPASVPAALVPEPAASGREDRGTGFVARPASPRGSRSPPAN